MTRDNWLLLLFIVAFSSVPLAWASRYILLKRLRTVKRDIWQSLGKPQFLDTPRSNLKVLTYLLKKGRKSDDAVVRLCAYLETTALLIASTATVAYTAVYFLLSPK